MTTEMEKQMIGAFYALTEEKANWEKDVNSSHGLKAGASRCFLVVVPS